ncbi:MAG: hypothetical protein LBE18_04015 [Planctomycetaceae bacterium]|jgi:hypothetical protein|nr:hypothetical protein [Planctomycetaceae bacterium]
MNKIEINKIEISKWIHTVISALIGGVIGAAIIISLPEKTKFDKLEVRDLVITDQAEFLSAGKNKTPEVLIKDGNVFVNNTIACKRLVGSQVQGHIFVTNKMLTSPDDLVNNGNKPWRFFTEISSTNERGGEIIVRSAAGAISGAELNVLPTNGWAIRAGYLEGDQPELSFISNVTKEVIPVAILKNDPLANHNSAFPFPINGGSINNTSAPVINSQLDNNPVTDSGAVKSNMLNAANPFDNLSTDNLSTHNPKFSSANTAPITNTNTNNSNSPIVSMPHIVQPLNQNIANKDLNENIKPQ